MTIYFNDLKFGSHILTPNGKIIGFLYRPADRQYWVANRRACFNIKGLKGKEWPSLEEAQKFIRGCNEK